MKCPFRIRTVQIKKRIDQEEETQEFETTQEFEECYGACCAAAYIVEYDGVPKVEGCKRLMKSKCP